MQHIFIHCTGCQKELRLPESHRGKKVQCPLCGKRFITPAAEDELVPVQLEDSPSDPPPTLAAGLAVPLDLEIGPSPHAVAPQPLEPIPPRTAPSASRGPARGDGKVLWVESADEVEERRAGPLRLRKPPPARKPGRWPIYLFILAILPLGLPLLALFASQMSGISIDSSILIWCGVAVVLTGLCLVIALPGQVSPAARLGGSLAISLLAFIISGAVLFVIALNGSIPSASWRPWASPDGRYGALMPGVPTQVPSPATVLADRPAFGQRTEIRLSRVGVQFGVDVYEAPRDFDSQQFLRTCRVQVMRDHPGGVIRGERQVWAGGQQAREFTVQLASEIESVIRYAPTPDRLYVLRVSGKKGTPTLADRDRFFNSFWARVDPRAPEPWGKPPELPKPPEPPKPVEEEKPNPYRGVNPVPAPTAFNGLAAWWGFEEGMGIRSVESSGKGYQVRLQKAEWATGVRGRGLRFKGDGEYLDLGNTPALDFADGAPFTIMVWVQTTDRSGGILSLRHTTRPATVLDLLVKQGTLVAELSDDRNEGGERAALQGRMLNDGDWHHIALVRGQRNQFRLYVDGRQEATLVAANAGGPITTDLRSLGLQNAWGRDREGFKDQKAASLAGYVDEFCVFNRALTAPELFALAGRGPVPPRVIDPPANVSSKYTVQVGGQVRGLAYSPDGQTLAVLAVDEGLTLWNTATSKQRMRVDANVGPTTSVTWSPDGKWLAVGGGGEDVTIRDAVTGEVKRTLQPKMAGSQRVFCVAVSPDGKKIVTVSGTATRTAVIAWDADTGEARELLPSEPAPMDRIRRVGARFTPDGKQIFLAGYRPGPGPTSERADRFHDAGTGKEIRSVSAYPKDSRIKARLSPDGKRLVYYTKDGTARVWDVEGDREIAALAGHPDTVADAVFSPDSALLATVSTDGTVKLWEVATSKQLGGAVLEREDSAILPKLAFSPDGRSLAGGLGRTVVVWEIEKVTGARR